jgi:DNA-binding transcriptional LysR family regulator
MRVHHLQALNAIAEAGSFTTAAQRLRISQSSLSHAIADLEQELGVSLLERNRQGAQPTEVGERVLVHARQALACLDAIRAEADNTAGLLSGRVRIGAIPSATVALLPKAIAQFSRQYPSVEVVLLEELSQDTKKLSEWLHTNTIDVALLELPVSDLHALPLLDDELCVLVAASSPLAKSTRISIRELVNEPFIMSRYSSQRLIQAAYARRKRSPQVRFEVQDLGTLINMVREGLGISIVPRLAFENLPDSVALVPLAPGIHRELAFALRSLELAPPAVRAFLRKAQESVHGTLVKR